MIDKLDVPMWAALFLEQNEHALCAGEFAPAIRALKGPQQ